MFDFEIAAVIPIAGCSQRFPSQCPKQYFKILGKPLFLYCVEEFYKLPYIKKICLVTDRVEYVQSIIEQTFTNKSKIVVVRGGDSRHASIRNGLLELSKCSDYKIVVIHDGARPIVPEQLLVKVISGAVIHGAAGATRPLISTIIKPLSDGCLDTSLDRAEYLASETPQAFLFHVIKTAYEKCSDRDLQYGTECLQLALEYCGVRAKLIPGPESLWKVTEKRDFYSVLPYIKELSTNVCILGQTDPGVIQTLKEAIKPRVTHVECLLAGSTTSLPRLLYNSAICFHNTKLDHESITILKHSLNIDSEGLIVHIIQHSNSEGMQSTSLFEIRRIGTTLAKQYGELNKGVIIIQHLTPGDVEKLIDLIVSLIFIDSKTISGQVLII